METINFRPWVGEKYSTEGFHNKRILILGESHHCGDLETSCGKCTPHQCPNITIGVIKRYLEQHNGKDCFGTFLTFERNLFNRNLSDAEAQDFWHRVVFYNYIQSALPKPGIAPSAELWNISEQPFRELLESYSPDKIIAWGTRLYNGLPDWGGRRSVIQVENYQTDVWEYTINDKVIPLLKVLHPCSPKGKARDKWHKLYNKFLEL